MPSGAYRPCARPGCGALVNGRARYCGGHAHHERARRRERDRTYDATRRNAAHRRFYKSARWQACRAAFLADPERGLCAECLVRGKVMPAKEVDHVIPLAQAWDRRFDWANLQGLCKPCHGRKTRREAKAEGNRRGAETGAEVAEKGMVR